MSTSRSFTAFFTALTAGVAITAVVSAQQRRDAGGQPPKGTSAISGRLVTQESTPQPVRRAVVTAIPEGGAAGPVQLRTAVTDDNGSFQIKELPEGRYTLTAQKPPFLEARFGSTRPGGAGTPITLKAGAQMTDVVLRMARGGVLSGRVVDENGDPAFGVNVRVLQVRNQFGERTLAPVNSPITSLNDVTDDRGMYRLYGLPPGEYVVAAQPRTTIGEIRAMTEEEIRAVMQALQEQRAAAATAAQQQAYGNAAVPNPNPNANKPPAVAPSDASKVTITYAQVFYPGATTSTQATTVTLGPGEERTGLDFPLKLVRTTTVEGVVALPEGVAPHSVQLMLQPVGSDASSNIINLEALIGQRVVVGPDGRFKYNGVAPGQYTLSARATRGSGPAPPPPPPPPGGAGGGAGVAGTQVLSFTARGGGAGGEPPTVVFSDFAPGAAPDPNAVQYWASTEVSVDGSPISGVALTLQPGMTVSGKVEFRSGVVRPGADFKTVMLNLSQVPTSGGPVITMGTGGQFHIDPTGNFTITGVMPGRYRLNGRVLNPPTTGPGAGDPWYVGSAIAKGQDVLDTPLVIAPNENITGAVITFTDTIQSIEGTLADAAGRAAPDFTIIVLPAEKRFWTANSRRIRSARPATDGGFRIAGLPPGEYRLSAVTDVRPDDLNDSSFLEQILGASIPITLAAGEKKKQDVKISGGL